MFDLERTQSRKLAVVEIEVMKETNTAAAITGSTRGITIQEAADRTGLTAHTLRYYERIGLIHEVRRGTDGRRRYSQDDLTWVGFLTKLRTTGMPIRDMCRYAELLRQGDHTVEARKEMLEAHRVRVAARIAELQQDLKVLDYKIDNYAKVVEAM
jgi:DNA-binding transcriptional MerR regulator